MYQETNRPEYRKWLRTDRLEQTETTNVLNTHITELHIWLQARLKNHLDAKRGITRFLTHTNKIPQEITLDDFLAYMEYVYVNRTHHSKTLAVYLAHLRLYMKYLGHPEWRQLIRLPFATRPSTHTTQLTVSPETEQLAQDIWNKWLNGELIPMQRTETTIRTYKHIILPIFRLLNKPPTEITRQDLLTIVQHMTQRHCKPQTINMTITVLQQLCNYHDNTTPFKTWKRLTEQPPVRRCPSKEQIETILQLAKEHKEQYIYPLIMTLGFTGLRITEACNLTIEDLDLTNRYIRTTKKRKKTDPSPINEQYLLPALQKHIDNNGLQFGHLWTTSHGTPVQPYMIRYFLNSVANKVGHWSPHDFRRGIATLLYRESNYDLRFVQRFLAHDSIDMTAKYIGVDDQELRDRYDTIINKLDFNV